MDCVRRIGGRCKDDRHYAEICMRLRPWVCKKRKQLDRERAEKKRLIMETPEYPAELGMGA